MARSGVALLSLLGLVVISACGGGQQQQYAFAIATSIQQSSDFPASRQQARCLGDSFVEAVGVEAFARADVTPQAILQGDARPFQHPATLNVDETTARDVVNGFDRCVDLNTLIRQGLRQQAGQLSARQLRCLTDTLSTPAIKRFLVAQYTGNRQAREQMRSSLMECLTTG